MDTEQNLSATSAMPSEEVDTKILDRINWVRNILNLALLNSSKCPLSEDDVKQIWQWVNRLYRSPVNMMGFYENPIDWKIWQHFDAHWIAKLSIYEQLLLLINILDNWIDNNRSFDSAPLEVSHEDKAWLWSWLWTWGGCAYKDGAFIILWEIDTPISKWVKYVLVNEAYYHWIDQLQKAYPNVKFIRADQINEHLWKIVFN